MSSPETSFTFCPGTSLTVVGVEANWESSARRSSSAGFRDRVPGLATCSRTPSSAIRHSPPAPIPHSALCISNPILARSPSPRCVRLRSFPTPLTFQHSNAVFPVPFPPRPHCFPLSLFDFPPKHLDLCPFARLSREESTLVKSLIRVATKEPEIRQGRWRSRQLQRSKNCPILRNFS